MSAASKFLEYLVAIPIGAVGWYATYFIGKPILELEKHRQESLRLADRYAYHGSIGAEEREDYERINAARREVFGEASALHSFYHSAPTIVRAYCKLKRYDIEQACGGLRGIASMIVEPQYHESTRKNNLTHVCLNLRANSQLSPEDRAQHQEALKKDRAGGN